MSNDQVQCPMSNVCLANIELFHRRTRVAKQWVTSAARTLDFGHWTLDRLKDLGHWTSSGHWTLNERRC